MELQRLTTVAVPDTSVMTNTDMHSQIHAHAHTLTHICTHSHTHSHTRTHTHTHTITQDTVIKHSRRHVTRRKMCSLKCFGDLIKLVFHSSVNIAEYSKKLQNTPVVHTVITSVQTRGFASDIQSVGTVEPESIIICISQSVSRSVSQLDSMSAS